MNKANFEYSIWTRYKSLVEANKEKRKLKGDWSENEPQELIYDTQCDNDTDANGNPITFSWQYTNLLSAKWVQDLFGVDWGAVQKLMSVNSSDLVFVSGTLYYREQHIIYVLDILQILAKSQFVNTLRPIPQVVKDVAEPVYTSKDLMSILNVKESTLSKYRANYELGYTKVGDKIWYTQTDLMNFLKNPLHRVEPITD
ncbi:MAG: helix-turn-helix domain-containing protein [Prevotella sp.]|nr:helix-turn-helix domain-containing protein [Prevotella sp.]